MKKTLFLLAALIVAAFAVYSCQNRQEQLVPTPDVNNPNLAVSDRSTFDTCDDCYNECNDCCLRFQWISGAVTLVYVNDQGNTTTLSMTPVTDQDAVVCARGGYLAILGGGSGTVTVCSTGESRTKVAGGSSTYFVGELTWDCDILP